MRFCGKCGAALGDDKKFCGDCGAPADQNLLALPHSAHAPDQSTAHALGVGCLILLAAPVAFFWWLFSRDTPQAPADDRPGQYFATKHQSYCATTEQEARLASRAVSENDEAALRGLILRNRLYILEAGTGVRWIWERPPGLAEVRIVSGEHIGITCFTLDGALVRK